MELAVLSGRGFTSLPEDEPTLRARLALSRPASRPMSPRPRPGTP
jgi:arginine/ornithine N-succinyltransferase beta subunit